MSTCRPNRSCVLKAFVVECWSIFSINTQSTSWSIPSPHSIVYRPLINSQSIVSWVSTNSYELIKISWLLTNCWPRCWWSVNRVSIKCQPRCWWSVNWVSIEGTDLVYQSRVSFEGIDRHSIADAFSTHIIRPNKAETLWVSSRGVPGTCAQVRGCLCEKSLTKACSISG